MNWSDLERLQPRLAELGSHRLLGPGVVLVGTVRADGTARISPVEPYLLDGVLWLSMLWNSKKARDLIRDPRILVHSVVTGRDGGDGEFKVRGRARQETEPRVLLRYANAVSSALGWYPEPGRFHLFAVAIDQVTFIRYDSESGDQYVATWPPPAEYVRRATSATSVGDPERVKDLLIAESGMLSLEQ
jgi:Pyridoxamine 5'-phosphate oxidase